MRSNLHPLVQQSYSPIGPGKLECCLPARPADPSDGAHCPRSRSVVSLDDIVRHQGWVFLPTYICNHPRLHGVVVVPFSYCIYLSCVCLKRPFALDSFGKAEFNIILAESLLGSSFC
eukprot:Gb_16240 [translate_table: standard]